MTRLPKKNWLLKLINFWPPYLGAGVRFKISSDVRSVDVSMKLRFWNDNYVGSHFGGSLYSMTDPFLMLILLENLGPKYVVWDKAASIRFKKPGKGTVRVHIELTEEEISRVRKEADELPKTEPVYNLFVKDEAGEVVAEVEKVIYVRRKDKPR